MAFFPGIISVVCRQTFSLPHPEQWDMVLGTMAWAGAGGMIKEFFLNPSRVMLPSQLVKTHHFTGWAQCPSKLGRAQLQPWQAVLIITDVYAFPPYILTMGEMVYLRSPEVTECSLKSMEIAPICVIFWIHKKTFLYQLQSLQTEVYSKRAWDRTLLLTEKT